MRIASSLDLCPNVIGIDPPIIRSCVLQVMLLFMMMLIERSSVVAKDRVIYCCRRWRSKMKTQCYRRWCSSTKDVKDCTVIVLVVDGFWKLPMTYRCITLMLLKMLSLLDPTFDVVVVSRIPFSLRGSVEIL